MKFDLVYRIFRMNGATRTRRVGSGFTLIEITVVMTIFLILSAIILTAALAGKAKARDNQRMADLKIVQIKLEQYRRFEGVYPATLDGLKTKGYLGAIPMDPKDGTPYKYAAFRFGGAVGANIPCMQYHLGATLENAGGLLRDAAGKTAKSANELCTGSANDFNGYDATANPNFYDLVNP